MPELPDLPIILRRLLSQLPPRSVTTYGQLAKALGSVTAAKWVASFLLTSPDSIELRAHRVVRADGLLGEYKARTSVEQAVLLMADGIVVEDGRVDLKRYRFDDFQSDFPLQRLADWQMGLSEQVNLTLRAGTSENLQSIGAVDVSYRSPKSAVAGYAVTDLMTGALHWSHTREQALNFPYISGFLGFRELPALIPLLQEVQQAGRLTEVLIVDGNGTLHPRGAGIASHLGVVTGLPTIGVSKTLPFGRVDLNAMQPRETRPIHFDGRLVGMAVRPQLGSHPLFVSPGHQMDLATATDLVVKSLHSHRLPEPQYWADRLSREAARKNHGERGVSAP